jgi:NAD-dependent dihydropyrimidine dehydrogenase PreA subunit
VIAEPCVDVMDRACVAVCPVDCIHDEQGVDRTLYIDPNECIDCDACVEACPVDACMAEDDVPAQWEIFKEINRVYFEEGHEAGERMVQEYLTAKAS